MSGEKQCYYDVLGVHQTATGDEIKVAYRRLALEWHPDKNRSPAAEKTFKCIVEAYGILSDRQERAWYDNHKSSLRGTGAHTAEDHEAWLFPFFNTGCYSGMGVEPPGFFGVFTSVFTQLRGKEPVSGKNTLPDFGSPGTSDEDVLDFYERWLEFSTKQSFAWCDEHPEHQAADRHERRAFAAENSRLRAEKKRSFNLTVRLLAKHVRTIDPRVNAALLRKKNDREERLRAAAAKREEKRRVEIEKLRATIAESESESEAESASDLYEELMWEQRDRSKRMGENASAAHDCSVDRKTADILDELSISQSEPPEQISPEHECLPCGKTFQSEKELTAHVKTSKHRQTVKSMGGKGR
ncbi:DnaJ-like protein [Perkinsela sp. CCAP 1560/4]|nr:DnaJ-like protein [Perkinsela sp. CCAP 1560/4]|eukprot:KNH06939.1 DnaJ-like protein [Perkinsela sp. CCAP 1560/4]